MSRCAAPALGGGGRGEGVYLRGRGWGRGRTDAWLSLPSCPGLPKSEHWWPRLLAGPEGRAQGAQDPGLPVGGRSPAQLQVKEGTWGG